MSNRFTGSKDLQPCGTHGAYLRHLRRKEDCDPCRKGERERARARNGNRPGRQLQACGTDAAYQRHLRHGEKPCEACREASRRTAHSNTGIRARVCEICGDTYKPTYSKQRTCGRTCGLELKNRLGHNNGSPGSRLGSIGPHCRICVRICVTCGQLFTARFGRITCSKSCQNKRNNSQRAPYIPLPTKPCQRCGQVIPGRYKWCDDCRPEATRQKKRITDRQRRLARQGALHDPTRYTLWEIAERDSFICGSRGHDGCGLKVNVYLSSQARMGPTIDHVIPFSISHDDRRTNVQLMHRACNTAKGVG